MAAEEQEDKEEDKERPRRPVAADEVAEVNEEDEDDEDGPPEPLRRCASRARRTATGMYFRGMLDPFCFKKISAEAEPQHTP